MKKLFGLFALLLCTILLSCNNLFSDKTGDISFSFSADDAIQAANAYLARGADNDEQSEYIFLVQIQGSEGFHDYQIKTVQATNISSSYPVSGQYLTDNKLEFLFDYVPFDQTYKVMFDMFAKIDSNLPHLVLSGNSNDIEVIPSIQTEVVVNIGNFTTSPISLKIEYEDDGYNTYENPSSIAADPDIPGYGINLLLFKEYGKLWHRNDTTVFPVRDIYYELNSNSNFPDSFYRYSLPYEVRKNNEPFLNYSYDFNFDRNSSSIKNFLYYYSFPASATSENYSMSTEWKAKISKGGFTFAEKLPYFEYSSNDEVISGHRDNVQFKFNKKNYDGGSAFVYTDELSSLITGTSIQNGDSIALVLTMKGRNPIPSATQLYYKELTNNSFLDNSLVDGQELFDGNRCLNHKVGETKFVIPLNFHSEDYRYLMMFITSDLSLMEASYTFDVDWYIFPQRMQACVLETVKEGNGYRYELNNKISDYYSTNLSAGQNYTAKLSGVVCNFNQSDKTFSIANTGLNTELYYIKDNPAPGTDPFTAISNNSRTDNIKFLNTYVTTYYDEMIHNYDFEFKAITNLSGNPNTAYKFMCHANCTNTNNLMVIRDYSFIFENN